MSIWPEIEDLCTDSRKPVANIVFAPKSHTRSFQHISLGRGGGEGWAGFQSSKTLTIQEKNLFQDSLMVNQVGKLKESIHC